MSFRLISATISLVAATLLILLLVADEVKNASGPGIVVFEFKNVTVFGHETGGYIVTESAHHIRGCRFGQCRDLSVPASQTTNVLLTISTRNQTVARMEFTVRELGRRLNRISSYQLSSNVTVFMKVSWYKCPRKHEC
jgi:hypothetical protein